MIAPHTSENNAPADERNRPRARQMTRWLFVALLTLSLPADAAQKRSQAIITGSAVVTDGDTIRIGEARIRLFGIDAPEGKQTCERDGMAWLCGQESAKWLRELVADKTLTCTERDRDRYKRIVAVCTLPDGRNINSEIVAAGMALAYVPYAGDLYKPQEADAKADKRGLWAGTFQAPWEWRRSKSPG